MIFYHVGLCLPDVQALLQPVIGRTCRTFK